MDILDTMLKKAQNEIQLRAQKKYIKKNPDPIPKGVFDKIDSPVSDHFTFGFGKTVVMPPKQIPGDKKYYIAGYRINNPAVGILDEMMAKALWIDDNSGRGGVVFVSVDCVGLFGADIQTIKRKLHPFCDVTGCRSINICSTHCHAGVDTMGMWGPLPKSGRDPEFMELLFSGICDVVKQAYSDSRNGQVYLGYSHADKDAQNAPRPPHIYSDAITNLRFVPDDGSKEIYMVNFASHPESLLGKNSLISADFPCYMSKYIEENKGAESMFFVGAVGGVRMNSMDDNNIESTKKTGKRLGELVCSINEEEKLQPIINILRQELYLTCDNPVFWAASKANIIPEKMIITGTGQMNLGMKTEMSFIQFGSINMLLIPGELFPQLAYGGYLPKEETATGISPEVNPTPLCDIAKDKNLLIFGLANGEIGYILEPNNYMLSERLPFIEQPKDRFGRKHYPETNSLGPRTAYDIAKTFKEMMDTVKNI